MNHTFFCVDGHTGGMPVRMVVGGAPPLKGANQSERRRHFLAEFDWIRKALMFEPRGHDAMSGSIIYPPSGPDFDLAIIYIETSGSLPMCGHGTIGTVTFALERGFVVPREPGRLRLETPAGLVIADYRQDGGKVTSVRLTNVPSFLFLEDIAVESPDLGSLRVDIAYGGNFYAILETQENYRDLADFSPQELRRMGVDLRKRIEAAHDIVHPEDPSIRGLNHFMWCGTPTVEGADARNCVIAGDNLIDRSPCGTGTSARLAQRAAKGLLQDGDAFRHESLIGSLFIGRIEGRTKAGAFDAVVPSIEGSAHITGLNTLFVEEGAPFPVGFQL